MFRSGPVPRPTKDDSTNKMYRKYKNETRLPQYFLNPTSLKPSSCQQRAVDHPEQIYPQGRASARLLFRRSVPVHLAVVKD